MTLAADANHIARRSWYSCRAQQSVRSQSGRCDTKKAGKGRTKGAGGFEAGIMLGSNDLAPHVALLHKLTDGRTTPIPGQTYPATFVTGMPSAV